MAIMKSCEDLSATNVIVASLVALFAITSWVGMNSIWVQLPLIVPELPEQWVLASYLTVIVQLANVAPLTYGIIRMVKPNIIRQDLAIYVILVIGCASMLLVGLFWDRVTVVAGTSHSLSLMLLAFFLSFADCSSSVVSLPYMSKFKPNFTTAYFVGLGLSSLAPSMVALVQGAGMTSCVWSNDSNGTSAVTPVNIPPLFSASTFFYIMFGFMIFCSFAFVLLNKWKKVEKCYLEKDQENIMETEKAMEKSKMIFLFALNTIVCAFKDGVLDSIQTFTSMPYGILPYHLAAALSGVADPLGCFTGFFVKVSKIKWFSLIAAFSSIFCAYLLVLASMSPNPPLSSSSVGAVLMVMKTL